MNIYIGFINFFSKQVKNLVINKKNWYLYIIKQNEYFSSIRYE